MYYSKVNWKEISNDFLGKDKEKEQFTKQLAKILNIAISSQQNQEKKTSN